MSQARRTGDSGQVLVETAITIPLLLLFFLAIFELGLLAAYRFTAEAAAHGGARCAAVGSGQAEVLIAVNELTLAVLGRTAAVEQDEIFGHARVEVTLQAPLLIPGLSRLFGGGLSIPVRGRCQMIREPE